MAQDTVKSKADRECEISRKKQRECLESDLIREIYYMMNEDRSETAAEMEADMKLEEALENGLPAHKVFDLACDFSAEAREAGFKMGFRVAMKLCMEGMKGGGACIMNAPTLEKLQAIQADLVTLEGMIGVLVQEAYSSTQTVLLGNALEVAGEYLAARSDKLDEIVREGMC